MTKLHAIEVRDATGVRCGINSADFENNVLELEVDSTDVSFDDLAKLSEEFGTRRINIRSETREEGYCETCRYTSSVAIVEISGITRWPGNLSPKGKTA